MMLGVNAALFVLLAASKVLIVSCAESNVSTDHAMNLEEYLNTIRQSPNVRPIKNLTKVMELEFLFFLSQLVSLDGAKQEIKMSAYFTVSWPEERLVWNASAFGNIKVIQKDSRTMWCPKIVMYNGLGDNQEISPPSKSQISHVNENISVATYVIRRDFSAGCTFDVIHFPNDVQTCEFQFYTSDDKTIPKNDSYMFNVLAFYNPSNEWTLVKHKIEVVNKPFKFMELGPSLKIQLFVCRLVYRRVYTYYMMNVVVPIILLSFLQILVFFVPTESGEKMSLGITILLSFTVFLLLLDNIIPKSVNLPVISTFITISMCLSATSLFLTSLILRLFHTPVERKMPHLMHAILVKGLGKLMLVNKEQVSDVRVASIDSIDKSKSRSSQSNISEIEEFTINKEQNTLYNPWIIAAMAMERLMLLLGFLLMIVMILTLIIPTFT